MIALGYALKKLAFLTEDLVSGLNRLVYYIALPVMLFGETARLTTLPQSFATAAAVYSIAVVIVTVLALLITVGRPAGKRGSFTQASFRSNLAYLGLPIVSAALGDKVLGIIAVLIAVGVVLHTTLSVISLRVLDPHAARGNALSHSLHIVRNPLIIAIAAGLLVAGIGIDLPDSLARTIDLLASMSLPVILLIIGFSLSFTSIGRSIVPASGATLLKLVVMPLIALGVGVWLFETSGDLRNTIVLMAAMPTAVVSQTFARQFNADTELAAATVSLDTIMALVTLPIWITLLSSS